MRSVEAHARDHGRRLLDAVEWRDEALRLDAAALDAYDELARLCPGSGT